MKSPQDITSRQRAIRILRALIEYPYHYTKHELSVLYNISKDAISDDLLEIKNAGFEVKHDSNFRYSIIPNQSFEYLKGVLLLSENEHQIIQNALDKCETSSKTKDNILKKLESINDFTKLGNAVFSSVYLKKLNLLEKAIADKQKVRLINYHSTNSQNKQDRIVEAFHVSPKYDLINAYDPLHDAIRHFKISRIERVEQIDDDWENEGKHYIKNADIFGIVDKNLKKAHLKLEMSAYNALIERYPLAKAYLSPSADQENIYELECDVNSGFLGISSFILGNYESIKDILEPLELRNHLNEKIKTISF